MSVQNLWERILSKIFMYSEYLSRTSATLKGKLNDMRYSHVSIPKINNTLSSWENLFFTLQRGAFRYISSDNAYIFVNQHIQSVNGKKSDGLEGFARTFLGLAFFLYNKQDTETSEEVVKWIQCYIKGIINGSNPEYKYFWGNIKSSQILVESASICVGLLIGQRLIWERLDTQSQADFLSLLRTNCKRDFWENNWLWFRIFHHLALEHLGGENHQKNILNDLDRLSQMYRGDGWYYDGIPIKGYQHIDYYNAYAMHFYGLLFAWLQNGHYEKSADELKERATLFFKDYAHFFSTSGHPPIFGRSMIYRFANISTWALGILTECCPIPISDVKRWMIDTVNAYLENGCVEKSGRLGFGVYREQVHIHENYSGGGSPYWAFKAFSVFLLPENHLFWQTTSAPNKKNQGIYSVTSGDIYTIQTEKSHVILINPNMTHKWYGMQYNKFAYSNHFLINLDMMFAVDNMLLLRREGTKLWNHRSQVIEPANKTGILKFIWRAHPDDSIKIQTTLWIIHYGYLVEHISLSHKELYFAAGGFAIPKQSVNNMAQEEDSIVVRGKNGISSIIQFDNKKITYDIHRSRKGIGYKVTFVPYIKGKFESKSKLTMAVIGVKNSELFSEAISEARELWQQLELK